MDSTPHNTTIATPAVGQSLVEFVRTNRATAGNILAGITLALLILTSYFLYKGFQSTPGGENDKTAEKAKNDNPLNVDKLNPKGSGEVSDPKKGDYKVGALALGLAFVVSGLGMTWLFASPPAIEERKQRSDIRAAILIIGGLLGIIAIVAGLCYFYRWSDSLTDWLDKSEEKQAIWTVISLMMVVLGSGLVFLAIQPARTDERNDALIRKLVYGANFVLTTLLLLVGLVVVNVFFSLKVPNKLDATATGFYSISENTRQLLQRLDQPVTAYAILDQEENSKREINDIRQLLVSCQDASDGKFKVKFLSQVADKLEYNSLRAKYPQLGIVLDQQDVSAAVLLTSGEGEVKRHIVLSDKDFFDFRNQAFIGESRLYKEISFLADNQAKPVLYFTQSNGEYDITGAKERGSKRSAIRLKSYLEKIYVDVKPLNLSVDHAVVPDDAAVVVIIEPKTPFSEDAIAALRKYMNNPAKKGKIIYLGGAVPGPDGKILKTGIEPLLNEYNISLGNQFIYNFPINQQMAQQLGIGAVLAQFNDWVDTDPVLSAMTRITGSFVFNRPRGVDVLTTNPSLQAKVLLFAVGPTWIEDSQLSDPAKTYKDLRESQKVRQDKNLSERPRPVAAVSSEGTTGRAVAFGDAIFVCDEVAQQYPEGESPPGFDLFGLTVDWLRDRSTSIAASAVEAKKYTTYQFPTPASVDNTRLIWLPLGLGLLTVVGLGAGVWVIRRK